MVGSMTYYIQSTSMPILISNAAHPFPHSFSARRTFSCGYEIHPPPSPPTAHDSDASLRPFFDLSAHWWRRYGFRRMICRRRNKLGKPADSAAKSIFSAETEGAMTSSSSSRCPKHLHLLSSAKYKWRYRRSQVVPNFGHRH